MPKSVSINTTLICNYCDRVRENLPTKIHAKDDCWSILKYFLSGDNEEVICPWCRATFAELFRIIKFVRDGGETVALSKENEQPAELGSPYEITEADVNAIHRRVPTSLLRNIIAKHPKLCLKSKSVEEEDKRIAEETAVRKVQHNKECELRGMSHHDLLFALEGEVDGDTRRISSDPPSRAEEYREELLRRLKPFKEDRGF